ncbi:hypothetical protein [Fulvivirga ligni]|nr:hypothetical protein [Fulvivirga ligni]UII21586.1 hypothetical protein LVD16_27540 [Fulvivirga ligni]
MNALEEFHNKLDSVPLDVTNQHDIIKELQRVNEILNKEGLTEILKKV